MCAECGCDANLVGSPKGKLDGKPQDPYGQYEGVGGTK